MLPRVLSRCLEEVFRSGPGTPRARRLVPLVAAIHNLLSSENKTEKCEPIFLSVLIPGFESCPRCGRVAGRGRAWQGDDFVGARPAGKA